MIMFAACTSQAPAVDHGPSVNPSSLYKGSGPSAATSPSTAGSTAPKPSSSNDPAIPPGTTGELVPGIGNILGQLTPQQTLVLDTANYLEIKQCMSKQGFKLLDPPPKLEVPTYGPVLFDAEIGILDKGYAEKYGYQLYLPAIPDEDQEPQQIKPPDVKYINALSGSDGDGGCDAKAYQLLWKNVPSEDKSTPLLGKIYNNSQKATLADPRYKKALRQWSQCMAKEGFDYPTPQAASGAYKGFQTNAQNAWAVTRGKLPHPSKAQVDTAVTDAGCKQSSGLTDVYRTVFWADQEAMAAKNRPTLQVIDKVRAQRLRNAQKMIKELG